MSPLHAAVNRSAGLIWGGLTVAVRIHCADIAAKALTKAVDAPLFSVPRHILWRSRAVLHAEPPLSDTRHD